MRRIFLSIAAICLLGFLVRPGHADVQVGQPIPAFDLPVPQNVSDMAYLGISSNKDQFRLTDLPYRVVIIEVFSMYCPYCQREAPLVNRFFQKIQSSETLKSSVAIMGIGVGNTDYEVNLFRKMFSVKFPLISDSDFSIHKLLGNVRTPHFICVGLNKHGTNNVFYSKTGAIGDYDQFATRIQDWLKTGN